MQCPLRILRFALILGLALASTASIASAQEPPQAPEPESLEPTWMDRVNVGGFGVIWVTPLRYYHSDARDELPYRIRFARFSISAEPDRGFSAKLQTALEDSNPFLDMRLTWKSASHLNITAGQFKFPLGASLLTKAPDLVMWDRPSFVRQATKATLRDVGVMVHTGSGGILYGILEYALGVFNGAGRIPSSLRDRRELGQLLWAGRIVGNADALVLPEKNRLALGLSYARSVDPATSDEEAANYLGRRLVPYTAERTTQIMGADITFKAFDVWFQGEVLRLQSETTDPDPLTGQPAEVEWLGYSLEAGYTIEKISLQPVARFDELMPTGDTGGLRTRTMALGVNFMPSDATMVSLFGINEVRTGDAREEDIFDSRLLARFLMRF